MLEYEDYKGKKVIIHDEKNKKTIAETVILDFNRAARTIMVEKKNFEEVHVGNHVSLLILGENGIFEYQGTVRQTDRYDKVGIALYSGKEKEDRKHIRYTVHAPAVIEGVMIGGRFTSLRKECEVDVVNISTDGMLICGDVSLLNIGTVFRLRMNVDGTGLHLTTTVVRSNRIGPELIEYGCTLNSQE